MNKFLKIVKTILYFIFDLFIIALLCSDFFNSTLKSWAILLLILAKEVCYYKFQSYVGKIGSAALILYGLVHINKADPELFTTLLESLAIVAIICFILIKLLKPRKQKPFSNNQQSTSTFGNGLSSYEDSDSASRGFYEDSNPNPISSEQLSGSCPYVRTRDSRYGHLPYYCLRYEMDISSDQYYHQCGYKDKICF